MGWTYLHKGSGVKIKEFFQTEFNWCGEEVKTTVLDCAVVGMKTAYLAVERVHGDERTVSAVICLLDYKPSDHRNFGYKDMGEGSRPYYYDCPERILNLLTAPLSRNAKEWREECRKRLSSKAKQPRMKSGYWLVLHNPVTFDNGAKCTTFYIQNAKLRDFRSTPHGGQRYRLNKQALDNNIKEVISNEDYLAALRN